MTLEEKAFALITVKTDEDKYEAVAKMTDKQKDIVIVCLMKVIQEQGFNLAGMKLQ